MLLVVASFFRRHCFQDIGGYIPNNAGGIDWIAVTTARMKGWKTRSFREKFFFHYRSLGNCRTLSPRFHIFPTERRITTSVGIRSGRSSELLIAQQRNPIFWVVSPCSRLCLCFSAPYGQACFRRADAISSPGADEKVEKPYSSPCSHSRKSTALRSSRPDSRRYVSELKK